MILLSRLTAQTVGPLAVVKRRVMEWSDPALGSSGRWSHSLV